MSRPDLGLFGPDSVTWKVHGDASLMVGGLRALTVQALNPRAMAAVDLSGAFRADLWGRLNRTTGYIMDTTFGDTPTAESAAARVRDIHSRVDGVDPVTGEPFRADDPDLLLWVHATEVDSFLVAYRRYGAGLSDDDADRYVREMVRSAELVGLTADRVPHSVGELTDYLDGVDDLVLTPAAYAGLELMRNTPIPLAARPVWTIVVAGTVATLPPSMRSLYGLSYPEPATPLLRAALRALFRSMNLALPGRPEVRRARARAQLRSQDGSPA